MSYILEALKKAQAERQLGSAPTIHAMPIQAAPAHAGKNAQLPLWIGAGAVVLLVAGAGIMWWRQAPAPVVAVAPAVPAPTPALVAAPTLPMPMPQVAPMPAPVPAPVHMPVAKAPPVAKPVPAPVVAPAPVAKAAVAEAPPAAPALEDSLPFMRDLPEQVRRELPQVTLGGYMYSKNPADRLILIDKVLRHEGEEVAPGLTLEKLLPKAALMNYRGTRYRVAY
ncbi:MAG: general secretion pathway protein GspB [Massilia sp.]